MTGAVVACGGRGSDGGVGGCGDGNGGSRDGGEFRMIANHGGRLDCVG